MKTENEKWKVKLNEENWEGKKSGGVIANRRMISS